jgi:hypothetical protein
MTRADLANEEAMVLHEDWFDAALIGETDTGRAVYSIDAILEILMRRDGLTDEEANEWFGYNIAGAYLGEYMPVYVQLKTENE